MMMNTCEMAVKVCDMPAGDGLILAEGLKGSVVIRLRDMLARLRFRVRVAGSVADAVHMSRRRSPALVLGAGASLERFMRLAAAGAHDDAARATARVAILEQGAPEDVLRLMMAGADECLVWPFSRQMLARRLARLAQFA